MRAGRSRWAPEAFSSNSFSQPAARRASRCRAVSAMAGRRRPGVLPCSRARASREQGVGCPGHGARRAARLAHRHRHLPAVSADHRAGSPDVARPAPSRARWARAGRGTNSAAYWRMRSCCRRSSGDLVIACRHDELRELLRTTDCANGQWAKLLQRLTGAGETEGTGSVRSGREGPGCGGAGGLHCKTRVFCPYLPRAGAVPGQIAGQLKT